MIAKDPGQWEAIQTAFDELVELDAESRARRLAAIGELNPALRDAVESLLSADTHASERLATLEAALFPQAMPDPLNLVGRTIFHFEVEEPLGVGGMGVVYRGRDTRLGRRVALKFLQPHYSVDEAAKKRFLREARAAAGMDHPHLCTIYDVRESDDGRLFLAMAFYEGETLKDRLVRTGALPVAEALAITRQVARGLACAHAAGIVHRDLKPGNVMLLPDGTVKILDFGIAKALGESASETTAAFGTVSYMAPEQIRGQTVDGRADLWAVGVLLYEMLTARKPFAGDHEVAVAHAIVHDEPVPPSKLRPGVPADVENIVLTLLQKDPSARPATVDDLIADLAAVEIDAPKARRRRVRTRSRRLTRRGLVAALGAGLIAGGIGGTVVARGLRAANPKMVSRYSMALPDGEGLAGAQNEYNRIAVSPDGERLVYVGASPDGTTQLLLRRHDQLHATPLTGTEGAVNPFFSPDGSRVGFVTTGSRLALKVISVDGGEPTTLADSMVDGGGAAWGYDGYIYYDSQLEGLGLARVQETGGPPEPATRLDVPGGELWHYQPEPLPSGRGVLFVIRRSNMRESDIAVTDPKTGAHRVLLRGLTPRYAASGHLVYVTVDGALMAVPFDQEKLALTGEPTTLADGIKVLGAGQADLGISATGTLVYAAGGSAAGQDELVWVARDGQATSVDPGWRHDFGPLALSPDGKELAVSVTQGGEYNLWIKRLDAGPASRLATWASYPSWAPDARRVAFVANSQQRSALDLDLYIGRADGSAPPRLFRSEAGFLQDAEYSRDGEWLLYRNGSDLFAVRTRGDTTRIPLVTTPFHELAPRLSPDGHWLAYSSDESGRREVYVRPFPATASARWTVSTGGGAEPLWSPGGRELFYQNARRELVAVAVSSDTTFAIGVQRVLFSTVPYEDHTEIGRSYDVSPDGRRFLMIRPPAISDDELIVVENFFEELKATDGSSADR